MEYDTNNVGRKKLKKILNNASLQNLVRRIKYNLSIIIDPNGEWKRKTNIPLFSGLQIPPPANWQDFETLCCDLWRSIWKDSNTQKNWRWGQPQHAVDICGRPNQEDSWAGVQCKGKDNYTNKSLAEKEVRDEVEKAKSF